MITLFDHTFSYIADNDLNSTLARFERAGFLISDQKVRHACGKLNGFAQMTGSYLEFMSVIDEAEFAQQAGFWDRVFRARPQPFGIGAKTDDARSVHRTLKKTFPEIGPLVARGAIGSASRKPAWTFCPMPQCGFPGAYVFGIQYHQSRRAPPNLRQGSNTIFGLGGFVFCTERIRENHAQWKRSLRGLARVSSVGSVLRCGAQQLEWISSAEYQRRTGRAYAGNSSEWDGIAAIKLFCADVGEACRSLTAEGFECVSNSGKAAYFAPDAHTGYTFELIERSPAKFFRALDPETRADANGHQRSRAT